MDLMRLLSGTDIRGTAMGAQADLTPVVAHNVARAFVQWYKQKHGKIPRTAVGRDSRLSGAKLQKAVINGLVSEGAKVLDCKMMSTPSMFMMTKFDTVLADGAIMVTASHHPFDKNGLKFFDHLGGLEKEDVRQILQLAQNLAPALPQKRDVRCGDYLAFYCRFLKEKILSACGEQPLKGIKIVVDAGNGSGGFFATRILEPLGADISASQFLDADGNFPNHVPNPENKQAMQSICQRVQQSNADFGIIFDTDVDRAAFVAQGGMEINRNRLIALVSAILLDERALGTIVTDSVTSIGLTKFIVARGGTHHRFKRGYKNVINEAVRLNQMGVYAPLAIETSGHAALKENYFLDDGAYLAIRILIKLAQLKKSGGNLTDYIKDLQEPQQEFEARMKILHPDFVAFAQKTMQDFRTFAQNSNLTLAPDDHEGVRILQNGGFFMLRQSVHDPVLIANLESPHQNSLAPLLHPLLPFFKELQDHLNITSLLELE